jgi:hypothetical protein
MSFRVLAKRCREKLGVRVSSSSLQRMVYAMGRRCKTPQELSAELGLDMWRGYLVTDEKHIDVRGSTMPWYLGLDSRGDIVHATVMGEQNVGAMVHFFETIRDGCHYRLRGLTSDQEQLFALAFPRVFAGKPHRCLIETAGWREHWPLCVVASTNLRGPRVSWPLPQRPSTPVFPTITRPR